jgi:intraflagellar transport protein 80
VIAYRQRFLERQNKPESNERFLQYSKDIEIDWETVKAKIRADKDREEEANK